MPKLAGIFPQEQKLILVAYDDIHQRHIRQQLENLSIDLMNISFVIIPTNDIWVRDYGPICIATRTGKKILDFEFDAWGQKYSYDFDNAFNAKLIEHYILNRYSQTINLVLEAGNLEINNQGDLLSSSTCFNRKSPCSSIDTVSIEEQFSNCFGCGNIFWINGVKLIGDDTDGHIDTLARFCSDDIIVYSSINNSQDANNDHLCDLKSQLLSIRKQNNNKFELVPLPLPEPIFLANKQLPASYANFLIINKSVLVPIFNDQQDDKALMVMNELFPSREIIGIDCTTMIQQFGGIHCATMHIPEGILE